MTIHDHAKQAVQRWNEEMALAGYLYQLEHEDTLINDIEVALRAQWREAATLAMARAERHKFYDSGYDVGKWIAAEYKRRAEEGCCAPDDVSIDDLIGGNG